MEKLIEEITNKLFDQDIEVMAIKVIGYSKKNMTVKKMIISLNDISSGDNILFKVKRALDETGFSINERLVEF